MEMNNFKIRLADKIIEISAIHKYIADYCKEYISTGAWLFQFGDKAQIVEPSELNNKYIDQLESVLAMMKSNR